jgi:RNA polymerase sigma-70 factor (ECF subfamily)
MPEADDGAFPTTHWTLISRLKSDDTAISRRALNELCALYRYPLYCYIRRRGLDHHSAEDALHDFLAKLIRLEAFETADAGKGRLRTLLAVALKRFLINRHHKDRRRREGTSTAPPADERYRQEHFSEEVTPEKALDRIWAQTLLQTALDDLSRNENKAGRGAQYSILEAFLSPSGGATDYGTAAKALGQTENAARQIVKRLRDRFRTLLRRRVTETLINPTPDQLDEEMKALRAAMAD